MSTLRKIAVAEGISFLVLLFIAMPIKYVLGHREVVQVVGMIHGILFIALVYRIMMFGQEHHWPKKTLWAGYISAVLPFGAFWFERKYLKEGTPS